MAMVATARQPPSFHQSQCCALNYIRTTLAFNSTQQHHICRRRFHSEPARARIPKGFAPATVYRLHARMARATINQRALAVREKNTCAKIDRRILCATDKVTISSEQLPGQPEQLPERPEQLPEQLEQLTEQPNQLPEQPEQHPKKLEQLPDQPKQLQNNAQNNANNTRTTRTTP